MTLSLFYQRFRSQTVVRSDYFPSGDILTGPLRVGSVTSITLSGFFQARVVQVGIV